MARITSTKTDRLEETNEPVQATQSNLTMEALLKRIEAVEAENKQLKQEKPSSLKRSGKEKYEGPRQYSYSLRAGVPVLSCKTIRKDDSKDLLYQDQFGKWTSNHYLDLSLANGKNTSVEVNMFNRDRVRTEKMSCTVKTNEQGETVYDFATSDYGTISVLSSVIN